MNISISIYNDIQRSHFRQEKLSNKTKTSHSLESSKKYFTLPRKGKRFLKLKERFIQYLIDQSIKYSVVFGHQEKIAEYLKCDVRSLRKVIRDLRISGWITVITTPTLCNIYILHEIFDDRVFCIGMNYVFNNLLVDKEIYRTMYASKHMHEQSSKQDIKSYHFQETVYDDERFRPKVTDHNFLDKIFSIQKVDYSKMPSLYKYEYTHTYETGHGHDLDYDLDWTLKELYGDGETINETSEDIFLVPGQIIYLKDQTNPVPVDLQTKKDVMKQYDLKSIKLTFYGQVRLSAFPEQAVMAIDKRVLSMKVRPQKPWQYFVSSCKRYCEENGLQMDWSGFQQRAVACGMPDLGPFIDESFIPVQIPSPVRKTYSKQTGDYDASAVQSRAIEEARKQFEEAKRVRALRPADPVVDYTNNPTAIAFRKLLGLNEEGVFIGGATSQEAVDKLSAMLQAEPHIEPRPRARLESKEKNDNEFNDVSTGSSDNVSSGGILDCSSGISDGMDDGYIEDHPDIKFIDACHDKLRAGVVLSNEEKLKLSVMLAGNGEVLSFKEKMELAIPIGPKSDFVYEEETLVDYSADPFGDRN